MTVSTFGSDAITVPIAVTLDDQVEFTELMLAQPEARQRRAMGHALGLIVYPLIGLLIGFVVGTAASGRAPTPSLARQMWDDDPWTALLLPWSALALLYAMIAVVLYLLRRPLLRTRLRRVLKQRPGIDLADPSLTEHVRCTFGPTGYTAESRGYTHHVPWVGIKDLQETAGILVVKTSPGFGYVLPKRDLPPHDLDAIRALAARHLNPQPGPWGAAT